MAELAFEQLAVALEATRGTAVTPPTHILNLDGIIKPNQTRWRGSETRGSLSEFFRSKTVYRDADWDGSGPLDTTKMPVLLNLAAKAVTAGVAAVQGAVTADNAKLWTFSPTLTADDIKTGTLYNGDPGIQTFQAPFATLEELTVSSDADSDDVVTIDVSGKSQFLTKVSAPTYPAQVQSIPLVPQDMQLWIDTSSAIATTAITNRLIKAEVSLTNNISYKRRANGPVSALTYTAIGRGRRHVELALTFEFLDAVQYDLWVAETVLKARLRLNGPLIELKTGESFYHYYELDIYGPFDAMDWDEIADTNRGITLTIISEYNVAAGVEWIMRVQNASATL